MTLNPDCSVYLFEHLIRSLELERVKRLHQRSIVLVVRGIMMVMIFNVDICGKLNSMHLRSKSRVIRTYEYIDTFVNKVGPLSIILWTSNAVVLRCIRYGLLGLLPGTILFSTRRPLR